MRVAICDDIGADRELLRDMLEKYFASRSFQAAIEVFSNAQTLLRTFTPGKYQLLFLDIYMPGMTGMDAAKEIRSLDQNCPLVFSTTSDEHALESFAVYASGYLLKPYTQAQLDETLDWCAENTQMLLETIEISCDWEKISLPMREIEYIEVYGRKSVFHTESGEYSANRSLSAIEQELTADFVRSHRCYIVNMRFVATMNAEGFVLTSGTVVPVSAEISPRARRIFFNWMFKNTWEGR